MFYGILVAMYVLDTDKHHHPHIHIRYNEFKAVLRIPGGELLDGSLPNRQMKLVQAWIELRQDELMADWYLASNGQVPFKIDPLRRGVIHDARCRRSQSLARSGTVS